MPPRIAIVGAGPAGLACAAVLAARGVRPTLFEKSRGVGGRVATRRRDGLQFDHGAQFLWIDDDDLLRCAREAGFAAPWAAAAVEGGRAPWVGTPRMKDILVPLAEGLDVSYSAEVTHVSRDHDAWRIETAEGADVFDAVVLAAPAPQILRFLDPAESTLRTELSAVRFAPCHALIVAFEGPAGWPDVLRDPPDPFALVLRDSSKPGRPYCAECYVAHTTAAWSEGNLETAPEDVAAALISVLGEALGPLPPVLSAMGHRWRFSQTARPLGAAFAQSADGMLLAGGDWALGRNVEDALASGRAMARTLMDRLSV